MPATVVPIRPGLAPRVKPGVPPCPVCGSPFALGDLPWSCDGCHVGMHEPCFWGRVASLAEWREYTRWVIERGEFFEGDDDVPRAEALCAACRAKGGA
jgi:hypothetical protein